ncbi:DUF4157 domain-containing protein [Fluviicola sp.]|uniref:eCIS core domain-containing protein n=1 Tax=Fluviicola sp. TaxID=1917219 RepID=UPI002617DD25|nr:DUF4157 domain-containing protein [Fluviicola sp.]
MKTKVNTPDTKSGAPFRSRGRDPFAVQAKLFVNQPGDQHETEADQAADRVVNSSSSPTGTLAAENTAPVQQKPIAQTVTPTIQRKENPDQMGQLDIDGTEDKMGAIEYKGPAIQRKEDESAQLKEDENAQLKEEDASMQLKDDEFVSKLGDPPGTPAPEQVAKDQNTLPEKLNESKGQGIPLPPETKTEMETGFGADFGNVKVHTGTNAVDMNKSLGAKAFTNKENIYFNQGKFDPASKNGKHLLAHELTHTIQQGASLPVNGKNPDEEDKKPDVTEIRKDVKKEKQQKGTSEKPVKALAEAKKMPQDQLSRGKELAKQLVETTKQGQKETPQQNNQTKENKKPENDKQALNQPIEKPVEEEVINKQQDQKKTEEKLPEPILKSDIEPVEKKTGEESTDLKTEGDKTETKKGGVAEGGKGKPKDLKGAGNKATGKEKEKDKKDDDEGDKTGGEDAGKTEVARDFDNPPVVVKAPTEPAVDKAGEPIEPDEEANINVEGLNITAQQFRDQGKEAYDRANTQATLRVGFQSKLNEISKTVAQSDKTLQKLEKNTKYRESKLPLADKPMATSKQRQQKVQKEVGLYTSTYNENKGDVMDLVKESNSLLGGSKENEDPEEADSGELTSNFEELSSGSGTISEGFNGTGDKAKQLTKDSTKAEVQNTVSDKNLAEAKRKVKESRNKIDSEKARNQQAWNKIRSTQHLMDKSKKQEDKLRNDGTSLMTTSFDIEEETRTTQGTYYTDMSTVPGWQELMAKEEEVAFEEMKNGHGGDALIFRFMSINSDEERIAFVRSLNENQRAQLGSQLEGFNNNYEAWAESKKVQFITNAENKRNADFVKFNNKRNKGLKSPLDRVTKNLEKVNKVGLFWSPISDTLTGMLDSLKNITWADVGNFVKGIGNFAVSMLDPTEWYGTISNNVMGIWKNLSDWGTFEKDPVGTVLTKGANLAVSLLNICGVISVILGVLTIAAGVAAFFTAGATLGLAIWLADATITMGTITFWIGVAAAVLGLLSGIKNIYDLHTAKTAETMFQETAALKKDAANTSTGILGMIGGKGQVKGGQVFKDTVTKFPKTWAKRGFLSLKNGLTSKFLKTVQFTKSVFKKETWTKLYQTFKLAIVTKTDDLFGSLTGRKKTFNGPDKTPDAPNKTPGKTHGDNKTPNKTPGDKTPDIDEGELGKLSKYEDDVDDATKKKMRDKADNEVEKGPNHNSKTKALVMARIIAKTNDQIDTPIPVLMGELAPLKAMKGVDGFGSREKGNGVFRIIMFGCEHEVEDPYELGGEKKNENQSEKKDNLQNDENKNNEGESQLNKEQSTGGKQSNLEINGGPVTAKAGKKFKDHFIDKKEYLEEILGTKYPKLKTHTDEFLKDISRLINEDIFTFVGDATLKLGQPIVKIYKGKGFTLVMKPDGEWVTLLEQGKGMDLAIKYITP